MKKMLNDDKYAKLTGWDEDGYGKRQVSIHVNMYNTLII